MASRVRTAAFVALLLLTGCSAPGLDGDQAAATRRTCASLRERVANRALASFELGFPGAPDPDEKVDDLDPRILVADPDRFYAALTERLDRLDLDPGGPPSPVSPATRLVEACRELDP